MKLSRRSSNIFFLWCTLTLAALCTIGAPAAQAQKITVESADPPMGEQGTLNLDVRIKGKNFKSDAVASFLVTGTANPGGITVNNTQFVSATELIANIDIADAAELSGFDIVVQSNGRTGKGIELFAVVKKGSGNTTSCVVPQPALTTTVSCSSTLPGCFDTTLSGTGAVFLDTDNSSGRHDGGEVVLVQPDSKIIVVGQGGDPLTTNGDVVVARFHMDGTLDTAFGNNGFTLIDADNSTNFATNGLLQPDGKILVTLTGAGQVVARLNQDGTLDSGFGSGGLAHIAVPSSRDAWALALQSDGKIVVVGGSQADWSITRLNADGTLDTTFGNKRQKGTVIAKSGGGWAEAVRMQTVTVNGTPVERILVAGRGWSSNTVDFGLMRFTLAGDLDTSFGPGGTGKVFTDFCGGSGEYPRGLGFDAVGNIVAGGIVAWSAGGSDHEFVVARYTANGVLDQTFGELLPGASQRSGRTIVDFLGATDQVYGMAIQADGKIVLSGYVTNPDGTFTAAALARFNSDGALDTTFGTNGLAVGSATAFDSGRRLALDVFGRILVPAVSLVNGQADIAVFRFWP